MTAGLVKDHKFLKNKSVKPATRKRYLAGAGVFIAFCFSRNLPCRTPKQLDTALEVFTNEEYFEGSSIADVRYVAWGYAWVRSLSPTKASYPKLHSALKGFKLASPEQARDALPDTLRDALCDVWLSCTDPRRP